MHPSKLPIVEIAWVDAQPRAFYSLRGGIVAEATVADCVSVGYLVRSDRTEVTILQSWHPDEDTATDSITIPRRAIKSMRRL